MQRLGCTGFQTHPSLSPDLTPQLVLGPVGASAEDEAALCVSEGKQNGHQWSAT